MKIKIVKDFRPNKHGGWIQAGDQPFEARRLTFVPFDLTTPFQIIDGPHSGVDVPFDCAVILPDERIYSETEYNAVNQELLQRNEEVREYRIRIETLVDEAIDRLTRHGLQVLGLEKEKKRQQDEVDAAREAKKVPLPKEVAEAIEGIKYSKDGLTDYGILRIFTESPLYKGARDALNKRYVVNSYTVLMDALVNGYVVEVEETADDKVIKLYKSIGENPTEIEVMRQMAILQGNKELLRRMDIVDGEMPY